MYNLCLIQLVLQRKRPWCPFAIQQAAHAHSAEDENKDVNNSGITRMSEI